MSIDRGAKPVRLRSEERTILSGASQVEVRSSERRCPAVITPVYKYLTPTGVNHSRAMNFQA